MLNVKLLRPVTMDSGHIQAGEILELTDLSGKALVEEGAAEYADLEEGKQEAAPGNDQEAEKIAEDLAQAEELAKAVRALNEKYNRDPLAEEAKKMGVEFAFDAKKAEIVEAVVAAGKLGALLSQ